MKNNITLLLPGFLSGQKNFITEQYTALSTLLSRASLAAVHRIGFESHIKHYFGLKEETLPVGALCAYAQGTIDNKSDANVYCKIDFVQFQTDAQTVFLKEALTEQLSSEEIAGLNHALSDLYAPQFSVPHANRTTLKLNAALDVTTNPLWDVVGKSLQIRMPSGPDGCSLQRLMTELQMQCNALSLNTERNKYQQPTIEGVWFWGFGGLPRDVLTTFDCIVSNELFVQGLAKHAQIPFIPLENFTIDALAKSTNALIIDTRLQQALSTHDLTAWHKQLRWSEDHYFAPIYEQLIQKRCTAFTLCDANDKSFLITPNKLKYFWRPIKTLAAFCEQEQ